MKQFMRRKVRCRIPSDGRSEPADDRAPVKHLELLWPGGAGGATGLSTEPPKRSDPSRCIAVSLSLANVAGGPKAQLP